MTFWNKVQQGAKSAAAEAEKQARSARLGMQIRELESDIGQKTKELGDTALGLIRAGTLTEPAFENVVAEITRLEARLAELRGEQSQLQAPPAAAEQPQS